MTQPALPVLPIPMAGPEGAAVSRLVKGVQCANFSTFLDIETTTVAALPADQGPLPVTANPFPVASDHPASTGKLLPPTLPGELIVAVQNAPIEDQRTEQPIPVSESIKDEAGAATQPGFDAVPVANPVAAQPLLQLLPSPLVESRPVTPATDTVEAPIHPHATRHIVVPRDALPDSPIETSKLVPYRGNPHDPDGTQALPPAVADRPAMPPRSTHDLRLELPLAARLSSIATREDMRRTTATHDMTQVVSEQSSPIVFGRPQALPSSPGPASLGATAGAQHLDFSALIDRIASARDTVGAHTVAVTLAHHDFGPVRVSFRTEEAALAVSITSPDPDFARAVAASPTVVTATHQTDQPSAGPSCNDSSATQAQTQGQSHGNSAGQQRPDDQAQRRRPGLSERGIPEQPRSRGGIFA